MNEWIEWMEWQRRANGWFREKWQKPETQYIDKNVQMILCSANKCQWAHDFAFGKT